MDSDTCPCCETECANSRSGTHYDELRMAWIADGASWRSAVVNKPRGWNGYSQLLVAGLISLDDFALLTGVPVKAKVINEGSSFTAPPHDIAF